ncbi:GmrSD restriction endonuclease domain-containing protein [Streptomyces nigra]|uniref:GmrSD restriction endonuclease domain-containing protein n=1 Tax=Streptomyces nigra TaxID=1827580 RepID=UPI003439B1A1
MHISQVLDKVEAGDIALPEFQRGYVWTRDQVRGFFQSLYRGYPIGGFLTWSTKAEGVQTRGGDSGRDGTIHLLLDGQQRVTTLYGVTRGRPPEFFEGNASALTGLHFHLDTEVFEFYAPAKMKDNPVWVDVTALFLNGLGSQLLAVTELASGDAGRQATYIERLNRITQIKDRNVHIDEVTGEDKTIDVVVQIFNRVNSGGTKLTKGDLALATICAAWPAARPTMNKALEEWAAAGFSFKLDWLLRNVNAVLTGEAQFSKLADVEVSAFRSGLSETIDAVSYLLNALGGRLGLDHGAVLNGRVAFPVMSRLLHKHGGRFPDAMSRDRLFYWYVHSSLWGRHTGATETYLNQDLEAVDEGGVDQLISVLRRSRGGRLVVEPDDFVGSSMGSRFYPLLYTLTRVHSAQDFVSGVPLRAGMLGRLSSLQVHHIFPKALLYKHDYSRADVNAVANFCFLTQDTNLKIGAREPVEYLEEIESRMPGALASQWIPMDRDLWQVSAYHDFLAARRELLARAANDFLQGLHDGPYPAAVADSRPGPGAAPSVVALSGTARADAAEEIPGLGALLAEASEADLAAPELDSEVSDPATGAAIVVAAAYWPLGLRAEGGVPVVLAPDMTEEEQAALEAGDYRIFHSTDALRAHIRNLRAED